MCVKISHNGISINVQARKLEPGQSRIMDTVSWNPVLCVSGLLHTENGSFPSYKGSKPVALLSIRSEKPCFPVMPDPLIFRKDNSRLRSAKELF